MDVALLVPDGGTGASRGTTHTAQEKLAGLGWRIVVDLLEKAGIKVGRCSYRTAKEHKVVLVSVSHYSQQLEILREVQTIPSWQPGRRPFVSIFGGAGIINPHPIRHYADWCLWGRAEPDVLALVQAALCGEDCDRPSVCRPMDPRPVTVATVDRLYPRGFEVDLPAGRQTSLEVAIGCPRRCAFCHYTWNASQVYGSEYETGQPAELTADRIHEAAWPNGRLTSALDGVSERLRLGVQKPLTDEAVIRSFNLWQEARKDASGSFIRYFCVIGYPTETAVERASLSALFGRFESKHLTTVVVSPYLFRPFPNSPMAWEGIDPSIGLHGLGGTQIGGWSDRMHALWAPNCEGAGRHLRDVITLRAGLTPDSDRLMRVLASKKYEGVPGRQVLAALSGVADIRPYLQEYPVGAPMPWDYVSPPRGRDVLIRVGEKVRRRLLESTHA